MNLEWSPEEQAFAEEMRAIIARELDADLRDAGLRATSVYPDHEASMAWQAKLHAAGLGRGQEEGHIDIGQIDHVEQLAAGGQHLAGLRHAVLHAAVAGGAQQAVVDVGLQAGDAGGGRLDGRLRLDHLGTPGLNGGLGRDHLGTRG